MPGDSVIKTPREQVRAWLYMANGAYPASSSLLETLRRIIVANECQPDLITDDWRLPVA